MDVDDGTSSQQTSLPVSITGALPVPEPGPSGPPGFSPRLDLTDMAQALPDFQCEYDAAADYSWMSSDEYPQQRHSGNQFENYV
jgi:hypothetical protein